MKPSSKPTAVITGGSAGIGLELCNLMADSHNVVTCGRSTRPEALVDSVAYTSLDITDFESVRSWGEGLKDIAVLVNNASILGERADIEEADVALFQKTMMVNVNGTFFVTRVLIPKLQTGAVIVNVSSSVGRKGRANWGAYSISKCALEGLNDILSQELDAVVFSANPGGTATKMRAGAFPDEDPATLPTALQVAEVIRGWIAEPEGLNGAKLNCRDVLDLS